ncbi:hypothetical protein FNV43_RR02092 [Rhamnella rubrinervis]|uniref:Uncharacterized protein n=1 Tax=Rhamnella rubrinervis TaxID=2594499 RepID=A0A8K0HS61_9ROSA|nr:hypothetical protein FNV43_RR02092 [Rhamnella rubrinervis]
MHILFGGTVACGLMTSSVHDLSDNGKANEHQKHSESQIQSSSSVTGISNPGIAIPNVQYATPSQLEAGRACCGCRLSLSFYCSSMGKLDLILKHKLMSEVGITYFLHSLLHVLMVAVIVGFALLVPQWQQQVEPNSQWSSGEELGYSHLQLFF